MVQTTKTLQINKTQNTQTTLRHYRHAHEEKLRLKRTVRRFTLKTTPNIEEDYI